MSNTFSHGYALLIGVGESAYLKWSLSITVKDMQALRAILTDPALCGYPDDDAHIRLLHDAGASKQAILDGLAWLAKQTAADSDATAVVFYSGHGWVAEGSNKYYLLPHDIEPFDLASSALSAETFTAALRQVKAKRLLVFVDSCHAAGMATAKGQPAMKLPSGFTPTSLPKGLVDELKQGAGRAVFSSSTDAQQSWVRPDGNLSLYTYHLIEALKGAGNLPGDTTVRVSNLMNHLGKAVPESARTLCHAEQTPFFDTAAEDFSVALLLGGKGLSGAGFSLTQGAAGDEAIKTIFRDVLTGDLQAHPEPGDPPYKGLDFYDVADAPLFFGREKLAAKLVAALRDHTFLAIVGDSGSGKSSLARAGVIAALRGHASRPLTGSVKPPLGSSNWHYVVMTPTSYPLEALARGMAGDGTEAKSLLEALKLSSRALREYAETSLGNGGHIVILVDQFEEIFSLCKNETERSSFLKALAEASKDEGNATPCTVIITLRADFYQQCVKEATLREILPLGQIIVGAMNREELKCVIELPAEAGNWAFQQSLVEQILDDVGDEPGNLPLLSYALLETWRQRNGRVMTLNGYHKVGRVQKAISQTADRVYADLEQQGLGDAARRIFLALVTPSEKGGATRRGELIQTLVPAGLESPAGKALKILSDPDARLVTIDQHEVQLVHDTLITAWPRLGEWLRVHEEELRRVDDLRTAAAAWDKATTDQKPEFLTHRGERLKDAQRLAVENGFPLGESIRTYLNACQEAETTRQRNRFRLAVTAVVVVSALSLLAAWFGVESRGNQRNAEEQKQVALANQLAAQAQQILDQPRAQDAELALLLSVESLQRRATLQGSEVTIKLSDLLPETTSYLESTDPGFADHVYHQIVSLDFSPDGHFVVTGSDDKTVQVWEVATGREIARVTHDEKVAGQWTDDVNAVAFSPDGRWIVSGGADFTTRVWDAATGHEIAHLTHDGAVIAVAFSPDGKSIISGSDDHTARVVEAATGHEITRVTHDDRVTSVAFSTDGKWAASGSVDGTVRVWEAVSGHELSSMTHSDRINSIMFSPDSKWIASSSFDSVRVWEASTGHEVARMTDGGMAEAVFSPDGRRIASGCPDYGVCVWEIATGRIITGKRFNYPVRAIAFSPDGGFVISSNGEYWGADDYKDYAVNVWDATSGFEVARVRSSPPAVNGLASPVAFSPDGTLIASVDRDGRGKVWRVLWIRNHAVFRRTNSFGNPLDPESLISPDGRWLLRNPTSNMTNTIQVVQTAVEHEVTRLEHDKRINAVAISQNNTWVVTGSDDNTARLWELATGREVARVTHDGPVGSVAISPDGKIVVSCGSDGVARVWEAASGRVDVTHIRACGDIDSIPIDFSPDGRLILSGGAYGGLSIWEAATGLEAMHILKAGDISCGGIQAAAFSPDGRLIVAVDGLAVTTGETLGYESSRCITASVWDVSAGRELVRVSLGALPQSVALSSDGRWLVTGDASWKSANGVWAHVWEISTGREMARIEHESGITHVAFSPDNHWVISSSGITRKWHWQTEDLIHDACSRLERNLTQAEWKSYLREEPYRQTCPNLPAGK